MKKVKKIFAALLALTMVLGMGVTTFAADSVIVTVTNASEATGVKIIQIIAPDTSKATGWAFVNGAGSAFQTAFGENDDQKIIWSLIKLKDSAATVPKGITAASSTKIEQALNTINATESLTKGTDGNWTGSVSDAGVYAIKATDDRTNAEDTYWYNPMSVYVAFGTYDKQNGKPGNLTIPEPVNAKKSPKKVGKDSNEADDVVYVGKEVEYTITTKVPYISENNQYTLTDVISGAEYMTTEADGTKTITLEVYNMAASNIKADTEPTATVTATVTSITTTDSKPAQTFTANLTNTIKDYVLNSDLVIRYRAKVTDTEVNNKVTPGDGNSSHQFTTTEDHLYTGTLTMTKTGESSAPLKDAKFVVHTTRNGSLQYAIIENGKVTGWTTYLDLPTDAPAGSLAATRITTGDDGKVAVKGFDDSEDYYFKEVEAPIGYSINTTDAKAVWESDQSKDESKPATRAGKATMTDTKLSSLPSTGGIGTTIFTIGGCALMIIAAGLYFATRRKNAK